MGFMQRSMCYPSFTLHWFKLYLSNFERKQIRKNTTAHHCDRYNWPQSPYFVVARHIEGEIDEAISQTTFNCKKREKHKKEMSKDPR